jgi:hypothetical protein
MEAIAQGVRSAGGHILGITNASFDPKAANRFLSEERKQRDLFDRIRELVHGSELFVVQEGSIGTLTELFSVWCLAYTQSLSQPVRICLIGKSWKEVITSLHSLPVGSEDYNLLELYAEMDAFFERYRTRENLSSSDSTPE